MVQHRLLSVHDFPTVLDVLPADRAFTPAQAREWGISDKRLRRQYDAGWVRRILAGVYARVDAPDTMSFRAHAVSLVVPPRAVITDRTAAWLHGVELLPRSSREIAPPVQLFYDADTRARRPGVASGRRGLLRRDIVEIDGIRVTSQVRTAMDLARLLWRWDALAAVDGFLRLGASQEEMLREIPRFRGYRGVVQMRALVPLGDPRSESPGESALRLHWYDAGLPAPTPQHWVYDDLGIARYRLDLALPDELFAAEYDGVDFHTSAQQRQQDIARRAWLADRGWQVHVFTKDDVYGPTGTADEQLRAAYHRLQQRPVAWAPGEPGPL